jgi:hypothetical protein
MQFFRSEDTFRKWQARHNNVEGALLGPDQLWELSKCWYDNRLSIDFRGRTVAQAEDIFRSLNLTSEFWYML